MNETVDVYVCNPDVGINKVLEAVFIQFEVMDVATQEGTGKSHTVAMPMPDAMWLLRHLENISNGSLYRGRQARFAWSNSPNRKKKN
jgi:hypothetical protein